MWLRRRFLPSLGLVLMITVTLAVGLRPDSAAASAASSPTQSRTSALLRLVRVPGTFITALYVTAPPADRRRLFIVQQNGRIRVVRDGRPLTTSFLDLSGVVAQAEEEAGLLSMAFAPDYATSGRFYVYYTDRSSTVRLVEHRRVTPDRASPRGRLILSIPKKGYHHQAGLLRFGPDRLLYVSVGDGNEETASQSLDTMLGKILRIDPRPLPGVRSYRIPPSNPFARTLGARPEIYAYGLRNPWRFDIDALTGSMVIADVGERAQDELNFAGRGQAAGRNYGWPAFEGTAPFRGPPPPGAVMPTFVHPVRVAGACAIIGGYVVRDRTLIGHYGRFLYADFCLGAIRSVMLGPGFARQDAPAVARRIPGISSFGRDALGRIYVTALNGAVYRLSR